MAKKEFQSPAYDGKKSVLPRGKGKKRDDLWINRVIRQEHTEWLAFMQDSLGDWEDMGFNWLTDGDVYSWVHGYMQWQLIWELWHELGALTPSLNPQHFDWFDPGAGMGDNWPAYEAWWAEQFGSWDEYAFGEWPDDGSGIVPPINSDDDGSLDFSSAEAGLRKIPAPTKSRLTRMKNRAVNFVKKHKKISPGSKGKEKRLEKLTKKAKDMREKNAYISPNATAGEGSKLRTDIKLKRKKKKKTEPTGAQVFIDDFFADGFDLDEVLMPKGKDKSVSSAYRGESSSIDGDWGRDIDVYGPGQMANEWQEWMQEVMHNMSGENLVQDFINAPGSEGTGNYHQLHLYMQFVLIWQLYQEYGSDSPSLDMSQFKWFNPMGTMWSQTWYNTFGEYVDWWMSQFGDPGQYGDGTGVDWPDDGTGIVPPLHPGDTGDINFHFAQGGFQALPKAPKVKPSKGKAKKTAKNAAKALKKVSRVVRQSKIGSFVKKRRPERRGSVGSWVTLSEQGQDPGQGGGSGA